MRRVPTEASTRILRCDPWAVSFVLAPIVMHRLRQLAEKATEARGHAVRPQDIAGALIALEAPDQADGVRRLILEYAASRIDGVAILTEPTRPFMLRLPAPVSLRLDSLIGLCRQADGEIAHRRELLGGLILVSAPESPEDLEDLFERYTKLKARDLALPGQPLEEVLTRVRPRPGIRRIDRPIRLS